MAEHRALCIVPGKIERRFSMDTMQEKVALILSEHALECKLVVSAGCIFAASLFGLRWMKRQKIHRRMEEERKRRADSVRLMRTVVDEYQRKNPGLDSRAILEMSLLELTEKLKDGSLSPEDVLYSYIQKALEVNDDLNCVTVFLTDCEEQLKRLRENSVKGPLYGIPVSIKEHIGYQGHPSTCGLIQYLDVLEKEDSVIVSVLKKQGAIVFAKTNVPQTLLCYETSNPIYGLTVNPHNKTKGAAGSSGGEGALIGGGGSILGIGTDIGGSIRLPSSFCGIAGFKPTANRLSVSGVRHCVEGMTAVPLCIGPMARDVDSLVLSMRALWCDELFQLDSSVPPIHFNEKTFCSAAPLRIGYYSEDGYFLANPGMRRVLLEAKQLLEEAGHQLVPFQPPKANNALEMFLKAIVADGSKTLRDKFDNNIVDPNLAEAFLLYNMSSVTKRFLAFILHPIFPRISRSLRSTCGAKSVQDHWAEQTDIDEYRAEVISEWRKLNLDAVVCPMLGPAYNTGYPGRLLAALSCTMLFNIVQFPAGVVPFGFVTAEDEEKLKSYRGYNNDPWDKLYKKAVEGGVGLPLSVQCAALPYQDEICLRLMKEIETLRIRHHKR
ncbi:vitamin D3 hydroxylase-associated protein-like [Anomaloglossus baeobatrachus]|uniref:vitamin D3 hydroxylase-associated protein-like n=1 Tax=Anomaloglossus baeobatrachus TaxID=238106 RepID=UPI003F503F09